MTDLQQAILQRFGLVPREHSPSVERAAGELARQLAVPVPAVLERAARDPEFLRTLAGHLTVDESFFLRQAEDFDLVLERVAHWAAAGRRVSLWSAGCSHGEEPYTLALLLAERLSWARPLVRIVASDLSQESIRLAKAGRFSDWSMRGVPPAFCARHFERSGDGWLLKPEHRAAVEFEHLSILERLALLPDHALGAILFRNVAIYLEPTALARIYQGFARVLAPDGVLLVGPSDPAPPRDLFRRADEAGPRCAYVPGAPASAPAAAPTAPPRRPAAAPSVRELHARAVELGDRGALPQALQAVQQAIAASPADGSGYALRATLLIAASRSHEAIADLRHALYLAPDAHLSRFLYATTLQAVGRPDQGAAEARELVTRLERQPRGERLEDGHTTVAELLAAARSLLAPREDR